MNFETRLYIKDIHSGTIHPWNSCSPMSQKIAIIEGELSRANRRSTNKEYAEYSMDKVMSRFRKNGYPRSFLHKTKEKFHRKNRSKKEKTEQKPDIFIKFPFYNEQIKRKATRILHRTGLHSKVKIWFDSGKPLKSSFHPPKERMNCADDCQTCKMASNKNLCNTKNLIYEITCSICNKIYIGETSRNIGTRIWEHINNRTYSAISEHFQDNHDIEEIQSSITWRILHNNLKFENKRRLTEKLYISRVPRDRSLNPIVR